MYAGRAVSLPAYLLIGPVVAWLGGILLSVRGFETCGRASAAPGRAVRAAGARHAGAQPAAALVALATGVLGVGLVVAFGTGLAMFAATYDAGKAPTHASRWARTSA